MNTSYIEIMNWDYMKSDRRLELVRDGSWDVQSLDSVGKLRLNEKLEMRNGGAAHKNMEAPQSIDGNNAMNWHFSH
uniref:hypothetical protein n=1 Tax=Dialister sp. TaxID=1955814 RepID=UPI0040269B09